MPASTSASSMLGMSRLPSAGHTCALPKVAEPPEGSAAAEEAAAADVGGGEAAASTRASRMAAPAAVTHERSIVEQREQEFGLPREAGRKWHAAHPDERYQGPAGLKDAAC